MSQSDPKAETVNALPLVVLIHGSWLGAWSWGSVATSLSSKNVESLAVSLSGLAGTAFAKNTETGLQTHVAEVRAVVDASGDRPIVLVGHSYGAVVATEVAGGRDPRIVMVVALDGPLVDAGNSIFTQWPEIASALAPLIQPDCPRHLAPPPLELIGLEAAMANRHPLVPMPLRTHTELAIHSGSELLCKRTFIAFEQFALGAMLSAKAAKDGWSVISMGGGHMTLVDQPEAVADLLVRLVAEVGSG